MLKKTNMKLELLTDYDQYLMVEQGLRGGIATKGYASLRSERSELMRHAWQFLLFTVGEFNVYGPWSMIHGQW